MTRPTDNYGHAPSAGQIEAIARDEISRMPEQMRAHLENVVVRVQDFADEETLRIMGIRNPFELSGLYQGIAVPLQSAMDVRQEMDMIFLYRRPILDEWSSTDVGLEELVRHIIVHEVGHHFGFSDDDMHRIERETG